MARRWLSIGSCWEDMLASIAAHAQTLGTDGFGDEDVHQRRKSEAFTPYVFGALFFRHNLATEQKNIDKTKVSGPVVPLVWTQTDVQLSGHKTPPNVGHLWGQNAQNDDESCSKRWRNDMCSKKTTAKLQLIFGDVKHVTCFGFEDHKILWSCSPLVPFISYFACWANRTFWGPSNEKDPARFEPCTCACSHMCMLPLHLKNSCLIQIIQHCLKRYATPGRRLIWEVKEPMAAQSNIDKKHAQKIKTFRIEIYCN